MKKYAYHCSALGNEQNKSDMNRNKELFMAELSRLGLEVGEWDWMDREFYDRGGFDICVECGDGYGQGYFDFYGEFRSSGMYVSPKITKMAEKYGYYIDWYNAGVAIAVPENFY